MKNNPPNIVHVTADSLRADHCGFLNRSAETTPALDQLADDSIVFQNAIAPAPRTPTSIPETVTGELMPKGEPTSHSDRFARISNHLMEHSTLAQRLSEAGYTTIGFVGNPWLTRRSGIHQGFDEFHELGIVEDESLFRRVSLAGFGGMALGDLALWIDRWRHRRGFFAQWETYVDKLFSTMRETEPPYYVWVFLMEPHNPYITPRQDRIENSTLGMYYGLVRGNEIFHSTDTDTSMKTKLPSHVEKRVERAYRDTIRSVDRFVGTLKSELGDDDVLLFHADHGEAFNEHGTYGHQHQLYEENIHVPLLWYDAAEERGAVIEQPFSLRGLPRLVSERIGSGIHPSEESVTSGYTVSRTESADLVGVRTSRYKYIYSEEGDDRLFDLAADPQELDDCSVAEPVRCERYRAIVQQFRDGLEDFSEAGMEEVPTSIEQNLKSLGYK